MPSQAVLSKTACDAIHSQPSNSSCPSNCEALRSSYNNQFVHHLSVPHSKSLDQYNQPAKFMENNDVSHHSFDQPFSSNYTNYDCTDGLHTTDRNNGYHGM